MQHGAANRSRHGSLWRQPSFQRGYQGFPAADMAPVSECPQSDSNAICGSYRLLVLVRACPGVATPRKGPDTRLTYQGAECRAGRYAQDQQHGAGLRGTLWKMTVLLTVLFIRKNKKPNIHGALKPSFDSCRGTRFIAKMAASADAICAGSYQI